MWLVLPLCPAGTVATWIEMKNACLQHSHSLAFYAMKIVPLQSNYEQKWICVCTFCKWLIRLCQYKLNVFEIIFVQDKDTDQYMPLLDQQTAPSKENPPLSLEDFQKLLEDMNKPLVLTHYVDPIPHPQEANVQLVPVQCTSNMSKPLLPPDDLETHESFKNYKSFHRLSRDEDREARIFSYRDLMNLMLSQTSEDKQLINVTLSRTKSEGPFCSNLEPQVELKRTEDKLYLQWPPTKATYCFSS